MKRLRPLLLVAFGLLISGCGSEGPQGEIYEGPRGTLSGTVTMGGKPVPHASLAFESSDGKFIVTGVADGDGKYSAIDPSQAEGEQQTIPAMDYAVTVAAGTDPAVEYDPNASQPEKVNIPEKYSSPDSSGLTVTVKGEGDTVFDVDLK